MYREEHDLSRLAAQAGQGDHWAATALKRELEPQLARLVRRAMRGGSSAMLLTQQLRAEAGPLLSPSGSLPASDREALAGQVAQVARTLCDRVVGRLQARAVSPVAARDTLRG